MDRVIDYCLLVTYTSSYVDKIYVCIATLLLKVKFRRI